METFEKLKKVTLKLLIIVIGIPVEILVAKFTVILPCDALIIHNTAEGIGKVVLGVLGTLIMFSGISLMVGIALLVVVLWFYIDD